MPMTGKLTQFCNGVVDENMWQAEFSQLTGDVRSNDNLNRLDGMI